MRQPSVFNRPATATAAALPAVAGSIALLLTGSPAAAVDAEPESRPVGAPQPGLAGVVVAPRAPTALQVPETYVVQRGDTVFGIALRYGLRTADVLALNGLTSSSIIHPGQVLRLTGTVPAASTPAPSPAPVTAASAYTVESGDTLTGIAERHDVTVQALFAANGLGWASIIQPGQRITIPGAASAPPASQAAPAPAPPAVASGPYTVQRGDTLTAIAERHKITVQALFAANGLGWASIIYPGQKLMIPGAIAAASASAATTPAQAPVPVLDAEQIGNVQVVIRVGRELGVPDRGIAIALGAAMQESWLRNLDWGDRDSLGLFQQRPSTGWGTPEQVRDADRATRAFFGGPSDPNGHTTRGLLDIPGWQSMTFAEAAQAVQISAYPDRYARWELAATTWLAAYG